MNSYVWVHDMVCIQPWWTITFASQVRRPYFGGHENITIILFSIDTPKKKKKWGSSNIPSTPSDERHPGSRFLTTSRDDKITSSFIFQLRYFPVVNNSMLKDGRGRKLLPLGYNGSRIILKGDLKGHFPPFSSLYRHLPEQTVRYGHEGSRGAPSPFPFSPPPLYP